MTTGLEQGMAGWAVPTNSHRMDTYDKWWAQGTPIATNRDWEPDPPYAKGEGLDNDD